MKLSEYQRSRSFFDLGQRSLRFQSQMFDFGLYTQVSDSGPHGPLVKNYCNVSIRHLFVRLKGLRYSVK